MIATVSRTGPCVPVVVSGGPVRRCCIANMKEMTAVFDSRFSFCFPSLGDQPVWRNEHKTVVSRVNRLPAVTRRIS